MGRKNARRVNFFSIVRIESTGLGRQMSRDSME
jgi:hypothetical protein